MYQAAFFRCLQRGGHLQGDIDRGENIEWSQAANAFLQRFAFDQFHRVKELAGLLANTELVHSRNVWVPERRCRARLACESLARFCAARTKIGVDDFKRD